eukprot:gnl/MRDRNA2_/MRDRNA2_85943_c0_seq1.p1 gnl/MRDRNA2_/MRDRNA2_85943_c0~~gnl/MRDRNA2_/MRDRNA2_85943_c0_seq1.p1  ORF type:complete len:247 (-),score=30.94 gnl/MRDRNA2_/MRDRNA2_85943_c0_seq1:338-1078(-)
MAPIPALSLFSCGHVLETTVLVLAHILVGLAMAPYQYVPWVGEAPLWWKMLLIVCGVLVAFIDHAGVYILKLCPRFSLDLQDKLKPLPSLTLLAGLVFYYSSLGQQFGAVTAWEMFGVGFVVPILIPSLLYIAFQKRKAAVADGSLLMPLCEDNVPTPAKQASIGNLTGLNFAMESATAVWDPNSTAFPSSQAQFQVAYTYLPYVIAHTFTDVGALIFVAIFWSMMDQDSRAILLRFYGFSNALGQ